MTKADQKEDLQAALAELGKVLERGVDEFGAGRKSIADYVFQAIAQLHSWICPQSHTLVASLKSSEAELAALIAEVVAHHLDPNAVPGLALIAKSVTEIGLERFCRDPHGTLGRDVRP